MFARRPAWLAGLWRVLCAWYTPAAIGLLLLVGFVVWVWPTRSDYLAQLNTLYDGWIDRFTLCPVLTVPADDLDYVANPRHLDLIAQKVLDKLQGKDAVVFAPDEVLRHN